MYGDVYFDHGEDTIKNWLSKNNIPVDALPSLFEKLGMVLPMQAQYLPKQEGFFCKDITNRLFMVTFRTMGIFNAEVLYTFTGKLDHYVIGYNEKEGVYIQ